MIHETAPAKVNLVLRVGSRRSDGLHDICSLFASLELADDVTVEQAAADQVVCPGVNGPNLAHAAIEAFRDAVAPDLPPLRVTIGKRIPVAAGLGGGSADAAAVLRAANAIAGGPLDVAGLRSPRARPGADVPSPGEPPPAPVGGAGGGGEPRDPPPPGPLALP